MSIDNTQDENCHTTLNPFHDSSAQSYREMKAATVKLSKNKKFRKQNFITLMLCIQSKKEIVVRNGTLLLTPVEQE